MDIKIKSNEALLNMFEDICWDIDNFREIFNSRDEEQLEDLKKSREDLYDEILKRMKGGSDE